MFKRYLFCLILTTFGILFYFSSVKAGTNANGSPNGLPCSYGGPDFRAHMKGYFPARFDRIGEDTRYSPGFDAAWHAQCLDPSASGVLQTLFNVLKQDISSGVITKCTPNDTIALDKKGNIQLCSDEADSYISIASGNWVWNYYDNGDNPPPAGGGTFKPQPTITPPTQGLPTNLGQLIQQIFGWSLGILGIAVFVMIFYAGFIWLTAAGNTSRISEARGHITNAVLGAVLLLSSYLILYTINPDFVKNTVNLPGLGKTAPNTEEGYYPPPPADALTKHPSQAALVASIKFQLESTGTKFETDCEVLEIVKRVTWQLKGDGAGLFKKPAGSSICKGFSVSRIVYSDGYLFKILTDAGANGKNGPEWEPDSCGLPSGNGTCPNLYSPPINPGPQ